MPTIRTAVAPLDRTQLKYTSTGLITASFEQINGRSSTIPTVNAASGTAVFALVGLRLGDVITNLVTNVTIAGTGLTFAKLALYDSTGTFLAATGSVSATFNSGSGYKSVALTTPYTITTSGGYYVAYLQYGSGATGATLTIATGTAQIGQQIGTAARPCAQVANLTDLNANVTLADTANGFWFGVS